MRGRHIHPVARNLYNLYQNHLDLLPLEELRGGRVERLEEHQITLFHEILNRLVYRIGHLPVVEEGRVVGIVTRSDYLRFAAEPGGGAGPTPGDTTPGER